MRTTITMLVLITLLLLTVNVIAGEIPFKNKNLFGTSARHANIGDIDLDGKNDIVMVTEYVDRDDQDNANIKNITLFKAPVFPKKTIFSVNYRACDLEIADMDNDGDLDIIGRGVLDNDDEKNALNFWLENPLPESRPQNAEWTRHNIGRSLYIKDIEIGDFNGDGLPDVATRSNTDVHVWLQISADEWENIVIPIHHHEGMDSGDMDRDGDPDLVFGGYWLETPANPKTEKWIEHVFDKKWFTQSTNSWTDNNCRVTVVDMNKDGLLDILVSHSEKPGYPISWYQAPINPRTGTWQEHEIGQIDYCHTAIAKDFDNDGDVDVLAGELIHSTDPDPAGPHPIIIFINQGNAKAWQEQVLANTGIYAAEAGDLGDDGDIDIIGPRNYNKPPIEIFENLSSQNKLCLKKWTYIQVDANRLGYHGNLVGSGGWFGLNMADLTGDGLQDIVAGRWFYRNPGGNMDKKWPRVALEDQLDILLALDVDGDDKGDVISAKCNEQYWFEATDKEGTSWQGIQIQSLPVCNHRTSSQGYNLAQIIPGGRPEILLTGKGIYYIEIPDNPKDGEWPATVIEDDSSNGEGVSAADVDGDGDLDVCHGLSVGRDAGYICWWENPGDGSANWQRHHIGNSDYRADKTIAADLNGDGRVDIAVCEERYPGDEPDASLVWFEAPEDPAQKKWQRHIIMTQHSMNSMDLADVDLDGDTDILTNQMLGMDEEVQIFENDGRGNFTKHVIDLGKENHLGCRFADLDYDGDLDIAGIAWNDFRFLHLWRNDAITCNGKGTVKPVPLGLELKGDQQYQLSIEIDPRKIARVDKVVEVELNFTQLLDKAGSNKPFDDASIRILPVDKAGATIDETVVFQFDKDTEYDAAQNAAGILYFIVQNESASKSYFKLLFGEEGGYYTLPVFPKQVKSYQSINWEGQRSYKIETQNATYYYHQKGSGFASMIDKDGNDWISYHPGLKDRGQYRGIPNVAPAGFHPGEGEKNANSRYIAKGPIHVRIASQWEDGTWKCTWDIFPNYATMTLLEKGPEPYWVLYEGTPGGEFNLTDYWVKSNGEREALAPLTIEKRWEGQLPKPKWVYFGDKNMDRVLYLIQHESENVKDKFWHFGEGGMTVFGFGRGTHNVDWQQLTKVPAKYTIGFAEDDSFDAASKVINSAYREMKIKISKPEKIGR